MSARLTDADRRWLLVVSALAALFLLSLLPRMLERLDPLTGDEPFYVMTAISIVRDGDLDEANNYAAGDYGEFYPADPLPANWRGWPAFPRALPPHPAQTDRPGLHTKHALGLSLLIALPYEVGGRVGAVLVVLACAAALAGQMYLLARDAGARSRLAALIALALLVTLPIAPYALLLFPEVPAALLLIYAVRRLAAADGSAWQWLAAGGAIGFLPWLHQRFAPTAALLGLLFGWRALRGGLNRALLPGAILVALGATTLLSYNLWLYGSPLQNTADHAGFSGAGGTVNGAFGLLLDAQWGLLIAAPVYLLAIVGIPAWITAARSTALVALAAALPYLLVVAAYRVWWGEWGPPARYLVPVAPLAAGALAAWLARAGRPARGAALGCWLIGVVVAIAAWSDPQRMYHHPDGINKLWTAIDERFGMSVAMRLVAFQPLEQSPQNERIAAALLLLALLVASALLVYLIPGLRHSSDRD